VTHARPRALADADYDVVIVGGGMAGAGVARELALSGLSVALVDKGDFGSATTSLSSKLIHGGLRYLELFDFGLVRESLTERERLQRLAPHLVRPLPFLVPIYRGASRGLIKVRLGMALYDWLTPGRDRERYRVLRPVDALTLEPGIAPTDLRGAGYYFDDLLVFPERLCLENVLSACRHGAHAFNYAQVEDFTRDAHGVPTGVTVRDLLSGRVATLGARIIVNATGPWVDDVRAAARIGDRGAHILRRTKGIHCLLPKMTEHAIYLSTSDDRMIFVIPWREFSLIGSTDTDFDGDLDRVHATPDEVRYLLGEARKALPDPRVTADAVVYTYAGVRPLSYEEGKRASDVSRAHKIVAEAGGRFLSITGTKLTCFRSLAQEAGEAVVRTLGRGGPSRSGGLTLDGADEDASRLEARAWMDVSPEMAASGLGRDTLETLVTTYGRVYARVVELAGKVGGGTERLCPHNSDIVAQLHHAVHEEMAVSLQDVLLRRTGIGTSACQGTDCAQSIGERMAVLCGWSGRRLTAELDAFTAHVERSHKFRG
jgi:glycerol-3-phosphate dehydrogenase